MEENGVDARLDRIEALLEKVMARLDDVESRFAVPPKIDSVTKSPSVETSTDSNVVRINDIWKSEVNLAHEELQSGFGSSGEVGSHLDSENPNISAPPSFEELEHSSEKSSTPAPPPRIESHTSAPSAADLEYKFGINGLLRGGVIVVLCAFLFLVALFIGRGMLSPAMQFGGEITFCFALIGIGIWKREEKEDFGQLMIGLGSCGLYASFAGAHVYKHLISSEVLVGLFFFLSLTNLSVAELWKSKSFFSIGFLGGLVTALLPMMKNNHSVDLLLHFLILAPSAIVVARNKWAELGIAMWLLSSAALLPICMSDLPFWTRAISLHLNLVICLLTFGITGRAREMDPTFAAPPAASVVSGVILVLIDSGRTATLQAVSLAAATGLVALIYRKIASVRDGVLAGGLISFVLFAPMGFGQFPSTVMYLIETAILFVTALRFNNLKLSVLGFITFACGAVGYILWFEAMGRASEPFAVQKELVLCLITAISVALVGAFYARIHRSASWVVASAVLTAILTRTVLLLFLPDPPNDLLRTSLVVNTVLACAAILAFLGYRLKFPALSGLSAVLAIWFAFVLVADISASFELMFGSNTGGMRQTIPGAIPAAILAASTFFFLRKATTSNQFAGSPFIMRVIIENSICAMFMRIALDFGVQDNGTFSIILMLGLSAMILVASIRIVKENSDANRWFGVGAAFALGLVWITQQTASVVSIPSMILFFSTLTLITFLSTLYFVRKDSHTNQFSVLITVLLAASMVSFFEPLLQQQLGMRPVAAWTASLTSTAMIMILVGFIRDDRFLRYVSLGLFGVTVLKVFMVDLAALDSMVRVAIMMLLGFAMIAGGYGYISMRKRQP
jgi:uncharacterized membrane protein